MPTFSPTVLALSTFLRENAAMPPKSGWPREAAVVRKVASRA